MIKAFLFKTLLGKIIVGLVVTGLIATVSLITYNHVTNKQNQKTSVQDTGENGKAKDNEVVTMPNDSYLGFWYDSKDIDGTANSLIILEINENNISFNCSFFRSDGFVGIAKIEDDKIKFTSLNDQGYYGKLEFSKNTIKLTFEQTNNSILSGIYIFDFNKYGANSTEFKNYKEMNDTQYNENGNQQNDNAGDKKPEIDKDNTINLNDNVNYSFWKYSFHNAGTCPDLIKAELNINSKGYYQGLTETGGWFVSRIILSQQEYDKPKYKGESIIDCEEFMVKTKCGAGLVKSYNHQLTEEVCKDYNLLCDRW